MLFDENQTNTLLARSPMHGIPDGPHMTPPAHQHVAPDHPGMDPLELEELALVLEHSLKVHTAHHFYSWTQGVVQNLIQHDLLICALRKGESSSFHVDTFSTTANEPSLISHLFGQDNALVPDLIKQWEENNFRPILSDIGPGTPNGHNSLSKELHHLGISRLLVHGTYDTAGRPVSLFIFAGPADAMSNRQAHLVELLVPTLHATWVHTQFTRPVVTEKTHSRSNGRDLLTSREHEVLGWICRGKSNIEIAMILGLSPLTIKNHVQKILRRLNVLNRAQAVGKALSLRMIDGMGPG